MAGRHQYGGTAHGAGAPPGPPGWAPVAVTDAHGYPTGLALPLDRHGTLAAPLEALTGPGGRVLHLPGGRTAVLAPGGVHALGTSGLALLHTAPPDRPDGPEQPEQSERPGRTDGPHPAVAALREDAALAVLHRPAPDAAPVLLPCTPAGRLHAPAAVLLRLPATAVPPAAGAPVVDTATGAVVALLAPGLTGARADTAAALPLAHVLPADLLLRNAESAPAFGAALNLGGILALAATALASATAGPCPVAALAADRVERPDGLTGEEPTATVTVLQGTAGSGRSTELAALAARRSARPHPLPTLWLRGADLAPADGSLAEALHRALAGAARTLGVPAPAADDTARLCAAADRPLLVLLDAPEEAPAPPTAAWHTATRHWLAAHGARLLLACRPESRPGGPGPVLHLGPLPPDTARQVAHRCGADPALLPPADAGHPQALRTAGELRTAGLTAAPADRDALYAAHLDLQCLRIARRTTATDDDRPRGAHRRGAPPPRGEDASRLRRTAARVAGRVHEAARLLLATGHAALTAEQFDGLFPAAGGWRRAVLAEGLFTRAGDGYRLAREDHADRLQGRHLDVDRALDLLLPPPDATPGPAAADRPGAASAACPAVPRHRLATVAAALRPPDPADGGAALAARLDRLRRTLDTAPPDGAAAWWSAALLTAVLPGLPDPAVHRPLLDHLTRHPAFGPDWWAALPLAPTDRFALLRRLVRTDPPGRPYRAAAAALLTADPRTAMPLLCAWFADAGPLGDGTGATVADLARDLLHTHRLLALDELTDTLVAAAHPRADALLAELAADEPSALCRAADRWSHDPRPERHVAAAVHAVRAAPHAGPAGRRLLRHTALTLLARTEEPALHGAALAVLVRDPESRAEHLPRALAAYAADDPFVGADALAPALADHPAAVVGAVRRRLAGPGAPVADALRLLAGARDPRVARQGVLVAADQLREHPERAGQLAAHLDALLAAGHDAGPLVAAVVTAQAPVRKVFAPVLATADDPGRDRLLDTLLAAERDPGVLAAVLDRIADTCAAARPERTREVVRRIAARWPGADTALTRTADRVAAFSRLLAEWPDTAAPLPNGPYTARRRPRTASGRDPQHPVAGPGPATDRAEAIPVPEQGRAHGTL
ncbi:serine protease [Kitasatospora sp. NBC_01539]|uniref:serine protease n=1 Tax=Kitasatospora sp. NBC_01539 TaxID=2903577 RepID=UPI0038600BD2